MATTKSRKAKRLANSDDVYYIAMFENGEVVAGALLDEDSDTIAILGLSMNEVSEAAVAVLGNNDATRTIVLAEVRDVQRFKINIVPSRVELEPVDGK